MLETLKITVFQKSYPRHQENSFLESNILLLHEVANVGRKIFFHEKYMTRVNVRTGKFDKK